jgi:disulfide oxidoreductase YuzD
VETTQVTEYYLKMRYGDAVQVEYVDMSLPENQEEFSELVAVVEDRDLPYPLLAINGHLRAAGSAHYYRVLPYVEDALEAQGVELES